ncbi:MAG: LPXTG cell wall anchor domain-containing protein [Clostridiales bacterium]|nr:LPXTG cell wall anchor domain-containing protein [Clostridiales bacterium]
MKQFFSLLIALVMVLALLPALSMAAGTPVVLYDWVDCDDIDGMTFVQDPAITYAPMFPYNTSPPPTTMPEFISASSFMGSAFVPGSVECYVVLDVPTDGYENITLKGGLGGNARVPGEFLVQYRLGTGAWTDFDDNLVYPAINVSTAATATAINVALPAFANDADDLQIRLVQNVGARASATDPTPGSNAGALRMFGLYLTGTAIGGGGGPVDCAHCGENPTGIPCPVCHPEPPVEPHAFNIVAPTVYSDDITVDFYGTTYLKYPVELQGLHSDAFYPFESVNAVDPGNEFQQFYLGFAGFKVQYNQTLLTYDLALHNIRGQAGTLVTGRRWVEAPLDLVVCNGTTPGIVSFEAATGTVYRLYDNPDGDPQSIPFATPSDTDALFNIYFLLNPAAVDGTVIDISITNVTSLGILRDDGNRDVNGRITGEYIHKNAGNGLPELDFGAISGKIIIGSAPAELNSIDGCICTEGACDCEICFPGGGGDEGLLCGCECLVCVSAGACDGSACTTGCPCTCDHGGGGDEDLPCGCTCDMCVGLGFCDGVDCAPGCECACHEEEEGPSFTCGCECAACLAADSCDGSCGCGCIFAGKEALKDAIDEAKKFIDGPTFDKLSKELQAKWKAALTAAQLIYAKHNAGATEIEGAINGLKLAKTGEGELIFVMGGVLLLAIAGLAYTVIRKRKFN